jgi:8-oxo-dGTP diphosphatase
MVPETLCFVFQGNPPIKILLGYKKRGFGQGKVGGFGGKIQDGESPAQAASRELYEEAEISTDPSDLTPFGDLTFIFPYKHSWDQKVYLFIAQKWLDIPRESEEMHPEWFNITQVPLEQMWDDAHYWLPHILAGERVSAVFTLKKDNETVKDYILQVI